MGANVRQWFDEMPKVQRVRNVAIPFNGPRVGGGLIGGQPSLKKTLESYMKSSSCIVCRAKPPPPPSQSAPLLRSAYAPPSALGQLPLCARCLRRPATALLALKERVWKAETRVKDVDSVCRSCSGLAWGEEIRCDSRDCPVYYTRTRERSRLATLKEGTGRVVMELEEGIEEEYDGVRRKKEKGRRWDGEGLEW